MPEFEEFKEFTEGNEFNGWTVEQYVNEIKELLSQGRVEEAKDILDNKIGMLDEKDIKAAHELMSNLDWEQSPNSGAENLMDETMYDLQTEDTLETEPEDTALEEQTEEKQAVEEVSPEAGREEDAVSPENNEKSEAQNPAMGKMEKAVEEANSIVDSGFSAENLKKITALLESVCDAPTPDGKIQQSIIFAEMLCKNPNIAQFDAEMKKYNEDQLRQQHEELLKQVISSPRPNDEQRSMLDMYARKSGRAVPKRSDSNNETLRSDNTPQKKTAPRSHTAELGEKPERKSGFFARIKDRIKDKAEQIKLDYHYAGPAGVLGWRGGWYDESKTKGDATFLRGDYQLDQVPHIKTLDFNRYPYLRTYRRDFTKIDHAVLPDPEKNPILNLDGSKLKGKLNLSAYETVSLADADLSQVTELDLSGCRNIDLTGVDLSKVKLKLPEPVVGDMRLNGTKFPKMEKLDLSQVNNVNWDATDMSQVDTVVMPKELPGGEIAGWPKHVDATFCRNFKMYRQNMGNVERITTPKTNDSERSLNFDISECSLPKLKSLDVSSYDQVCLTGNNMPALETLTVGGKDSRHEIMYNNSVPSLENVRTNRSRTDDNAEDKRKMFETYKNISRAVLNKHKVYKDAETGRLCPVTENQRKAIEIIEKSARWGNDGLQGLWNAMSDNCRSLEHIGYSRPSPYNNDPTCQKVLTEYNKALSQALGLKSYVNMETLRYEQTPPLKTGEKMDIPPFSRENYERISRLNTSYRNQKGTRNEIERPAFDKWGRHLNPAAGNTQIRQNGRR